MTLIWYAGLMNYKVSFMNLFYPALKRKGLLSFFLLCLIELSAQSQNNFLEGSLTNKSGEQQKVLIQYKGWKQTPQKFNYQLPGSDELLIAEAGDFSELVIPGKGRYRVADVKIDVSSNKYARLSFDREPIWQQQTLVLEEIISGGASLLFYKNTDFERFFYKKPESSEVIQLIYKKYKGEGSAPYENREFRKQLRDEFTCSGMETDVRSLVYELDELKGYIDAYNQCMGYESKIEVTARPKATFLFGLKGGLASYGGKYTRTILILPSQETRQLGTDFERSLGLRLGVYGELVLPQQNRNWSVIVEGQFESFSTSGIWRNMTVIQTGPTTVTGDQPWSLDVSHFVFSLGGRRYFYLADGKRLFLSAGLNSNFVIDFGSEKELGQVANRSSTGEFIRDLSEVHSFYAGFGFAFNKMNLELRYDLPRQVLGGDPVFSQKYTAISFMAAFQLTNRSPKD